MESSSNHLKNVFVGGGALLFAAGLVLTLQSSCSRQVSTPAGYGLAYFPESASVVAWGDGEILRENPEVAVWPHGQAGLEIHQRAFQKLGLPIEAVERIAIGYALNSSPVEMAMVLTGKFDEKALIASAAKAEKTSPIEVEGISGVSLARGYVMLPVAPGRVLVGHHSFVKLGVANPRPSWEAELANSMVNLPDGQLNLALLAKNFHFPGIDEARAAIGFSPKMWLDMRLTCPSPEACDRFPAWLEIHMKGWTPGLTKDPEETKAFQATVNLDMSEKGGRLTAGTPPESHY